MPPFIVSLVFNRHFWTAIPFLLFAAGLGLTGLVIGGRGQDLARDGVETTATVVERQTWTTRSDSGTASRHFRLTVTFLDTALNPVTLTLPASPDLYERVADGDSIPVRHLPDNTSIAELDQGATAEDAAGFQWIARVLAVVGLVFLIRAVLGARRANSEAGHG